MTCKCLFSELPVPANFSVVNVTENTILLSWTKVPASKYYKSVLTNHKAYLSRNVCDADKKLKCKLFAFYEYKFVFVTKQIIKKTKIKISKSILLI